VGDLEFIQTKVLAGDYFQVTGAIDAINDTIEYVPATGKTAFLIEAKIVITTHTLPITVGSIPASNSTTSAVKAALKIDTTTVDTTNVGMASIANSFTAGNGNYSNSSYGTMGDGRFNVLGLSLVGNSSKKIEIENTLDGGSAIATLSGYLV
jgi:hypothetical protein